jgi:hypothetical protein
VGALALPSASFGEVVELLGAEGAAQLGKHLAPLLDEWRTSAMREAPFWS